MSPNRQTVPWRSSAKIVPVAWGIVVIACSGGAHPDPAILPVARLAGPGVGFVGDALVFDASASLSAKVPVTTYRFSFGDGTLDAPQTVPVIPHVFTHAGSFTVSVTVFDPAMLSSSASIGVVIRMNQPPVRQ